MAMSVEGLSGMTINREALSRVVTIVNGKGGVFKTTLTANVGGMLAQNQWRVLLVDLDPQGNLGDDLGYSRTERDDRGQSLAQALGFGASLNPIVDVRPGLDVIVGGSYVEDASALLANRKDRSRSSALAVALEPVAANYDLVIIDCPPGDETLQTLALVAAQWALIPIKSDRSSQTGMELIAARLQGIVELNPALDLLGVVLVDTTPTATSVARSVRSQIAQLFGDDNVLLNQTVRHAEATAFTARNEGLLVHEIDEHRRRGPKWYQILGTSQAGEKLAPRSAASVADDLKIVTQEIVDRLTLAEERVGATA